MRVFNQVTGAPYTDCFNPEEEFIVLSTSPDSPKCIIRHSVFINFHKSSMMSGIITGKSFEAQKGNFGLWQDWAEKGLEQHLNF